MRLHKNRRLPYLLNTRYRTEKGASHARLTVVDERREDNLIAEGGQPMTVEEWNAVRRHEEELALAKLRQLREDYEKHVQKHGR